LAVPKELHDSLIPDQISCAILSLAFDPRTSRMR
jgi:hypothetical protein